MPMSTPASNDHALVYYHRRSGLRGFFSQPKAQQTAPHANSVAQWSHPMSHNTSHELVNFFVDASKALEERPGLERKLRELSDALEITNDTLHSKDERIDQQLSDISNLKAQLVQLERDKEAAEYAALEAKDQAEKLIRSIGEVMKGAAAADAILNPTPEPLPQTSSTTAESHGDGAEQSDSSSVQAGPSSVSSDSATGSDGGNHSPSTEDNSRPKADDALSQENQSHDASSTHMSSAESTTGASTKPYSGQDYWDKPNDMSWSHWIAGGGERGPWVHSNDDDRG